MFVNWNSLCPCFFETFSYDIPVCAVASICFTFASEMVTLCLDRIMMLLQYQKIKQANMSWDCFLVFAEFKQLVTLSMQQKGHQIFRYLLSNLTHKMEGSSHKIRSKTEHKYKDLCMCVHALVCKKFSRFFAAKLVVMLFSSRSNWWCKTAPQFSFPVPYLLRPEDLQGKSTGLEFKFSLKICSR